MKAEVFADADAVAAAAARWLADACRKAVAARRQFAMAVSGGTTPWQMLRALASEDVDWSRVHVFQVDERIAPEGHSDRNLTHLRESLLSHAPLAEQNLHAMPVNADDLDAASEQHVMTLQTVCQGVLDVVHLGLGADGHTASLVPGDPVLDVVDRDVAITQPYQGRRRMTLTYPVLNRARDVLWLATGKSKQEMLQRLIARDDSIPAGRVEAANQTILVDRDAVGE